MSTGVQGFERRICIFYETIEQWGLGLFLYIGMLLVTSAFEIELSN